MRVGQKTRRTRIWTRKGTRPRQVTDLRTACVYLFGAICPLRQTGTAAVMQRADTQVLLVERVRLRPGGFSATSPLSPRASAWQAR